MKAIVDLTPEMHKRQSEIWGNLRDKTKGLCKSDMFEDYRHDSGYTHYKFSGKVSQALINALGRVPTGDEIIMLVDSGFSHFGASCCMDDLRFSGRVNTD